MEEPLKHKLQTNKKDFLRLKQSKMAGYFSEILNRSPPMVETNIPKAEVDLDISTDQPIRKAVIGANKTIKNEKSPAKSLNTELSRPTAK